MTARHHPSPQAARLALRHRLGNLEHTFLPSSGIDLQPEDRGKFVAVCLTTVAGLVIVGVVLWVSVSWTVAVFPLFIAALTVGALLRSPNFRKSLASRRLYLFEEGLLVDMGPGRLFAVRWERAVHYQDTVREVLVHKGTQTPFSSVHTSTVVAPGGSKTRISHFFDHHDTWAPLIEEAILRAQIQRVWDAVREGRRVRYGPLELSAAGIGGADGHLLPWPDVEAVDARGGYVVVRRHGQVKAWTNVPVKAVPNLLVFLTVASNLHHC